MATRLFALCRCLPNHFRLNGSNAHLTVVHFGIILLEKAWPQPWLLSSAGLDLDICEQSIVENERFEKRILLVQKLMDSLSGSVAKVPPIRIPQLTSHELTAEVTPIHLRLHTSDIPPNSDVEIEDIQGWVRSAISRKNRGCRLLLPQVSLAELKSPNNTWPTKPEKGPQAWTKWLVGAIRTVIEGDRYTFKADDLPGPWKPLHCMEELSAQTEDSAYATFWPTGQLHQLLYARHGRAIGWVLTLEEDQNGSLCRDGITLDYRDTSNNKPWGAWVQDWIETIYLEALA